MTATKVCGDVDQETRDNLVRVFKSGFASGVASLLVHGGTPGGMADLDPVVAARATAYAQRYVARVFDDPAVRAELEHDLAHLWIGGVGGFRVMEAHSAHTTEGDHQ